MKICVSLRDPAPANLRSGNLRSEPRWERQALEASLENPQVTDVYTTGRKWSGSHPKYRGQMQANAAPATVLLLQDWNVSTVKAFNYRAAIVNVFSGPWDHQRAEVKDAHTRLGGRLIFTMGFPIMHRNELGSRDTGVRKVESHLEKFLPRENILCLPVPGTPGVVEGSNFDKPRLLWAQRCIFMSQMGDSETLLWSLQKLDEDSALTLDVLSGWRAEEVKDYVDGVVVKCPQIVTSFWQLEKFAPFTHLQNRVNIHLQMDWENVLSLYGSSKLLVTYGRAFGGPPIEAGTYGVPFIASGPATGALVDCDEYLFEHTEQAATHILQRLLTDRAYYDQVGNSYRNYVRDNYTYKAFNNNLNKIISDKGVF